MKVYLKLRASRRFKIFSRLEDFSLETIGQCKQLTSLTLVTQFSYKLSEYEFRALANLKKLKRINFRSFPLNFNPKESVTEFPVNHCKAYFRVHINTEDYRWSHPCITFLISHFPNVYLDIIGIKVDKEKPENMVALNSLSISSFEDILKLKLNRKTTLKFSSYNQLTGWKPKTYSKTILTKNCS